MAHGSEKIPTTYAGTAGVAGLRQFLNSWKLAKLSNTSVKYIEELEQLYRRIFPGHSFDYDELEFRGISPTPENTFFLLRDADNGKTYDVEEMSSGEQAVFPILYEFVRRRIRNSVVLIDEIDLNLHPPAFPGPSLVASATRTELPVYLHDSLAID